MKQEFKTPKVCFFLEGQNRTACGCQSRNRPNDKEVTCLACRRTRAYRKANAWPIVLPEKQHPVRFT